MRNTAWTKDVLFLKQEVNEHISQEESSVTELDIVVPG
jgi:hypothetical protein